MYSRKSDRACTELDSTKNELTFDYLIIPKLAEEKPAESEDFAAEILKEVATAAESDEKQNVPYSDKQQQPPFEKKAAVVLRSCGYHFGVMLFVFTPYQPSVHVNQPSRSVRSKGLGRNFLLHTYHVFVHVPFSMPHKTCGFGIFAPYNLFVVELLL